MLQKYQNDLNNYTNKIQVLGDENTNNYRTEQLMTLLKDHQHLICNTIKQLEKANNERDLAR